MTSMLFPHAGKIVAQIQAAQLLGETPRGNQKFLGLKRRRDQLVTQLRRPGNASMRASLRTQLEDISACISHAGRPSGS